MVFISPLECYLRFGAIFLNLCAVVGAKGSLPRKPDAWAEVTHQHPAFFSEAISDFGRDAVIDFSHVSDWRLAALLGGPCTKEPYLHRPIRGVGQFVVHCDTLIRREFGRGVNPVAHLRARACALDVMKQLLTACFDDLFEIFRGRQIESSKEYRSVRQE